MTYYKNDLSQSSQGITGNELNRVYADNKRPIIWIATQRDGLNAYNYNKQVFTAYSHNPDDPHSLITNDVTDIAPSAQHEDGLWISTYYRGIEYLDINSGSSLIITRIQCPPYLVNKHGLCWTEETGIYTSAMSATDSVFFLSKIKV